MSNTCRGPTLEDRQLPPRNGRIERKFYIPREAIRGRQVVDLLEREDRQGAAWCLVLREPECPLIALFSLERQLVSCSPFGAHVGGSRNARSWRPLPQ